MHTATSWLREPRSAFIVDLPADRREEFHERVLCLDADDRVLRLTSGVWSGTKPW